MLETVLIILATAVVFTALIADIAKNQQSNSSGTLTGVSATIASFGGLIIYGYAYTGQCDNAVLAGVKTLLATLGMFLGKNEYSSIASGAGADSYVTGTSFLILFWAVHLLALYATTNAVLATIGARALKHLRILVRKGRSRIVLIYGVDKHSVAFGAELAQDRNNFIIYIDKSIDANVKTSLNDSGCLYYVTGDAVNSSLSFLKKIGVGKRRKISVYAISQNEAENFDYAIRIKEAFQKAGIPAANTTLSLIANMEMRYGEALQNAGDYYGFGSVMVLDRPYLAAHALCSEYPPCDYVAFDTQKARAVQGEVFNAVIIGFGKIGQAVLKNLVINGQFEGAEFKATVFDPKHPDISGYLYKNSKSMMSNYDITLLTDNAQQSTFYEYVEEHSQEIDYIVVCTGKTELNAEITGELQSTLTRMGGRADIFQCTYENIIHLRNHEGEEPKLRVTNLYTRRLLDITYADNVAMQLNHIYCGGESAMEDWAQARFMDRMSSRASAAFAPAFLRMTGLSKEEVLGSDVWQQLTKEQMENLAKTEHLRWNAFHYSMGFVKMPDEEFERRSQLYRKDMEEHGRSGIKIQKDMNKYYHTCLVSWDQLDEVTEKYKTVTGDMKKNYKEDDANNVRLLDKLLRVSQQFLDGK